MNKSSLLVAAAVSLACLSLRANEKVDFAKEIYPILEKTCVECHGPDKSKGKLRLDKKEFAFRTEDPVIVAGKADDSELYKRIILPADHDDIMPSKGDPLTKAQTDLIKKWINEGAEWTDVVATVAAVEPATEAPAEPAAAAATPEAAAESAATVDFAKQIFPVFEKRCIECHGPDKDKGDLRLDERQFLFHDERDSWVVIPGKPDESELIKRITLPADHDDIMPAKGDPLSQSEIEAIRKWIAEGAVWPEGIALKKPERKKKGPELAEVKPTEAENKAVAALGEMGVPVRPIAMNVNWKEVNFRLLSSNLTTQALPHLKEVITLVDLNLADTPVTDSDLANIAGLTNLTRLHLEKTAVTDAGLEHLRSLVNLTYLNLYGTQVSDQGLPHLKGLTNLSNLYLWQTKVTEAGVQDLKTALPDLEITLGWDLAAAAQPAAEEKKEEAKEEKKDNKEPEKK